MTVSNMVCFGDYPAGNRLKENDGRGCFGCVFDSECVKETLSRDEIRKGPRLVKSDGSTASYYQLPAGASELQHLISHRDMNAQIGEIFRACYRYGQASHSDQLRDAKKILFYANAEVARLEGKTNG